VGPGTRPVQTQLLKKKNFGVMEYIYEYFLEIVEALNQIKNFFNKHCKEYYLASFLLVNPIKL
jgi:hypothetical protein